MEPEPRSRATAPILLVDDDADVLESMRMVLEDLGCPVETATSGAAVLSRLAAGAHYRLVVCDVGMPGMDGWEVARRLRAADPQVRIVLLTGFGDQISTRDPKRALVDKVLCKPIDLDALEALATQGA